MEWPLRTGQRRFGRLSTRRRACSVEGLLTTGHLEKKQVPDSPMKTIPTSHAVKDIVHPEISYAEAVNQALRQAMELNDDVLVLGQLIDYKPGVFGSTTGLVEQFGPE